VPFFGDLPILGRLFRNDSTTSQKTELLVFVTPRIVNERMTVR
jgi:type IV pilus assembly protein PilQ